MHSFVETSIEVRAMEWNDKPVAVSFFLMVILNIPRAGIDRFSTILTYSWK